MTDRRRFLLTVLACATGTSLVARAQRAEVRIARIGIVADPPHTPNLRLDAFRQALRELGYVEGRDITLEIRSWDGTSGATAAIVADLIRLPVDVLVLSTTGATLAAKRATTTIPIVAAGAGALVEAGAVASLARPGGNVTGLVSVQPELSAKRLEILKEALPTLSRVAVLMSPYREVASVGQRYLRETEEAASTLGLRLRVIRVEAAADLDAAFQTATESKADACIILSNPFWSANAKRVGEMSLQHRIPVMSQDTGIVEAGGLLQYGVDITDLWRRAAAYVDKILKGAKPADLPIEQPTKFELIVNVKAAKALGLALPQSLILRADKVIQ
jgi:putative ABC transport system substrate-binding protein